MIYSYQECVNAYMHNVMILQPLKIISLILGFGRGVKIKFDFTTDAEMLNYLNGKEFSVPNVWFAEQFPNFQIVIEYEVNIDNNKII